MLLQDLTLKQIKVIVMGMGEDESLDIFHIQAFFEDLMLHMAIPIMTIDQPFIIRCSINDPGEVFNNISRCSYHPDAAKVPLQRCNYAAHQVFYAAVPAFARQVTGDMTAILETTMHHAKNKNIRRTYMTLSRWKFNRPFRVFALPFTKRSVRNSQDFKEMSKRFNQSLRKACRGDRELYRKCKDFLVFMSSIFCKRGKRQKYYRISSAFFNALMSLSKQYNMLAEGLVYPSANSKAEGMNIVLVKDIVDSKSIEADLVVMYVMERDPSNPKEVGYHDVSDTVTPDANGHFAFRFIR